MRQVVIAAALFGVLVQGASAGAPYVPKTRSEARGIARAINLSASDLPGWRRFTVGPSREDLRDQAEADRCAHAAPHSRLLAETRSKLFAGGSSTLFVQLQSVVQFWPTVAQARRDLRIRRSALTMHCIRKSLVHDEDILNARISRLRASTPTLLALRVTLRLRAEDSSFRVVSDVYTFRRGSALITLSEVGGPGRPPARIARDLLRDIAARAEQQLP